MRACAIGKWLKIDGGGAKPKLNWQRSQKRSGYTSCYYDVVKLVTGALARTITLTYEYSKETHRQLEVARRMTPRRTGGEKKRSAQAQATRSTLESCLVLVPRLSLAASTVSSVPPSKVHAPARPAMRLGARLLVLVSPLPCWLRPHPPLSLQRPAAADLRVE